MSRLEYKSINVLIQRGRIKSAKRNAFIDSIASYLYEKVKQAMIMDITLKQFLNKRK